MKYLKNTTPKKQDRTGLNRIKIDQNGIKHNNKVNSIKCNAIWKVLKDFKNTTPKKQDQTGSKYQYGIKHKDKVNSIKCIAI